ncbi:MAG: hypothetical protein AAB553_02070 [Patescibacteria group bacterium]
MKQYTFLPFHFLHFWYVEAPVGLFVFLRSVNDAFLRIFSLPLFIKTFFKPLKNEYREGLVGFSRAMGITLKTMLIPIEVVLFLMLLTFEAIIFVSFLAFPILTLALLFL